MERKPAMDEIGGVAKQGKWLKRLHLLGFVAVYILWNYHVFLGGGVQQGLEGSWVTALNWASSLNLKWSGDNLVFSYGPLYYLWGLMLPEFHPAAKVMAVNLGLNLFYLLSYCYI